MKTFIFILALSMMTASGASAAPADTIADALVEGVTRQITPDSLPTDFARLTKFIRHDGPAAVLFTDGGMTDGYVRHAQAHFDTAPAARDPAKRNPLFTIGFEMVNQSDFTFEGLAAALEQRLGTPNSSSNQTGATFRRWNLKQPADRSVTVAPAQASDNGDPIVVVQITQDR